MPKPNPLTLTTYPFPAMGSMCSMSLWAASEAEAEHVSNAAIYEVHRIETKYSRYRPDNVMADLNRHAHAGTGIDVDEETGALIAFAAACNTLSGGLFDITSGLLREAWDFTSDQIPTQATLDALLPRIGFDKLLWEATRLEFTVPGMELDFGGIAKEYAADRAVDVLTAAGVPALVDLGGDIAVTGLQPDSQPWRIAIRDPRNPSQIWKTVDLAAGGLATSGDYERCIVVDGVRHSHILNPQTGRPALGLASVTVVSDQCMVAGALATITLLKGREGPPWLTAQGHRCLWMDVDGNSGGTI